MLFFGGCGVLGHQRNFDGKYDGKNQARCDGEKFTVTQDFDLTVKIIREIINEL
jgi:hypothetical protein